MRRALCCWLALGLAAWCLLATYAARVIGCSIRLADRGGPRPVGTCPSRGHRDAGRRLPTRQDIPAPPRERH